MMAGPSRVPSSGRRSPLPAPDSGFDSSAQLRDSRQSISSNRSKRGAADFEAALLNPNQTIFLSGSPLLEDPLATPPRPSRLTSDDAPLPIEKRSYEDDLKALATPKSQAAMKSPAIIPPTPPPETPHKARLTSLGGGIDKRMSVSTLRSENSGTTNNNSPGRASVGSSGTATSIGKRLGPSLGIDAELNEGHKPKPKAKSSSKRRNIFRSPGTASSPDLATLVRKAKEAKSQAQEPAQPAQIGQAPAAEGSKTPHSVLHKPTPPSPTRHAPAPPPSLASGSRDSPTRIGQIGPSVSMASHASSSSSATGQSAPRTTHSGSEDGWDRFSDLKSFSSAERMATISEGRSRSRESSKEEHKSLRNKAKGVFGRMFGGPHSRDHTTTTSLSASSSVSRFPSHGSPHPPVPPVPANFNREADRKSLKSPPISSTTTIPDAPPLEAIHSPESYETPLAQSTARFEAPLEAGRQSITPTGRRVSDPLDKPLPPVVDDDDTPSVPIPSASSRRTPGGSLHVRQPAYEEDSPPLETARLSPRRPVTMSFSDDVAGIFETIGQSEPANELGLPPDSMRIIGRSPDRKRGKFPADLSRSMSSDSPRRDSEPKLHVPAPVAVRTSSLPSSSPRLDLSPAMIQRATSSPRPSQTEDTLALPLRADLLSRSPSNSSRRRVKTEPTGSYPSISQPNLGSPMHVSPSEFGVSGITEGETTLRPVPGRSNLPPLSPASVRLVHSPTNESGPTLGRTSSFIESGPWGRQSPAPRCVNAERDPHPSEDLPKTPQTQPNVIEDDEERGRRLACEFLDDDFSSMSVDKVAEFLGGPRAVNAIALGYYMQYFNMKGQTLVESFRDLCAKLHLRAESQEIDRIIEGFSARFFDCNPETVFGTPGVVHTVTGAMLMLNTDLHIADLTKHMSRADFIKNSLRAIQESMPDRMPTPDLVRDDSGSVREPSIHRSPMAPLAHRSTSAPVVSHNPPVRSESDRSVSVVGGGGLGRGGSSTTVSSFTYNKAWESEAEAALKDIFNQVRADKILLPIGNPSTSNSNRHSIMSFNSDLGRNKTVRSPSGRSNDRLNALKRGSIRGMQGLIGSNNNPYGSNFSSSDGRLSPTPSYATSINETIGSAFAPTVGFASNLSHTVIREHEEETRSIRSRISDVTEDDDLDDDELALLGAPWAKEGMLWKRSGTDGTIRKTSKKDWKQFFVVVQKGEMLLFTFGSGSGSATFGAVGGGNWLNNANTAGRYSLIHCSASHVVGGHGKDRPYVFKLSFVSNESLFFQAGTDDLVLEWVNTCNYWSSRNTRQPLQGGVSNMEYGWARINDPPPAGAEHDHDDRASIKSSKSNMSRLGTSTLGRRSISKDASDRIWINDWKPPLPALVASTLDEENQLEALMGYLRGLKDDMESHRLVEEPMMRLYTPHSKNAHKAHANWSLKFNYLQSEIQRYEGYVDTLKNAIALRIKKQGERKLEKSLARSMTSLHRRESEDVSEESPAEKRAARYGLRVSTPKQASEGEDVTTPVSARRS